MYVNISDINEKVNALTFNLTTRLTNASDMYNLMKKLNTEQETSGELNILQSTISDYLEPHKLFLNMDVNFFEGREDVILELGMTIHMYNDCELDNKDLTKEFILGTVLNEVKKHFGFLYKKHDSDLSVVKAYFQNY